MGMDMLEKWGAVMCALFFEDTQSFKLKAPLVSYIYLYSLYLVNVAPAKRRGYYGFATSWPRPETLFWISFFQNFKSMGMMMNPIDIGENPCNIAHFITQNVVHLAYFDLVSAIEGTFFNRSFSD